MVSQLVTSGGRQWGRLVDPALLYGWWWSGRVGTFDEEVFGTVDRISSSLDRSELFGRRRPVTHRRARLLWELFILPLANLVDGGRVRHCGILYGYRAVRGVISHAVSLPGGPSP